MLKIFGKERKIDINFLINDSIHQENYNELIHKFKSFYREESNLLINLVNLHYNKEEEKNSIFYQLKKLFSRLNYLKKWYNTTTFGIKINLEKENYCL